MLSSAPSRGHPHSSSFCPGGERGRPMRGTLYSAQPRSQFPKLGIHVTSLIFSISTLPLTTQYFCHSYFKILKCVFEGKYALFGLPW